MADDATGSTVIVNTATPSGKAFPDLRLLHYNDVYHVESGSAEPVGGVARFQSIANHYRSHGRYAEQPSLLTFFSGDAFNPSLESSVTKGRHMVSFLNAIGTNVSCVGNHDLDFGISQFENLKSQCTFPWLLANVLDPALGKDVSLARCEKTKILVSSNGVKIGVIGLAEREWLATINTLPPDLIYKSASTTAEELVPDLRSQGCELIIALTHMREPNDIKLAQNTSDGLIDLILGGHDHYYNHQVVKSTHILRSGTDFRNLSYIEAWKRDGVNESSQVADQSAPASWTFSITRRDVVHAVPEDPDSLQLVDKLTSSMREKLNKPIGYTAAPLDGRFTTVRLRESNLGNFVCDLMRHYHGTDCALMAGGTIRGDQVYPPGILRMKDIMNCFPFEDPVVVLKLNGLALFEALENSVSLVPALEGRFPQVSNIAFEFNADRPAGSRVLWVKVGDKPLSKGKFYTLATRGYMARGKDGFRSLLAVSEGGEAEEIVSEETGILISTLLRQYFLSLKILGKWKHWAGLHTHWDIVQTKLHQEHTIKHPAQSADQTLHRRSLPSQSGTQIKTANASGLEVNRQTMAGSDSDGSLELPVSECSTCTHPLARTASSSSKQGLSHEESDYLYYLARAFGKKWMQLAGIKRENVGMVAEHGPTEIPSWTAGIAPRVEGRIIQSQN